MVILVVSIIVVVVAVVVVVVLAGILVDVHIVSLYFQLIKREIQLIRREIVHSIVDNRSYIIKLYHTNSLQCTVYVTECFLLLCHRSGSGPRIYHSG